ncbi:unnamed protein product [Rotaria socialis]|uniref:Uncharacterized protein n=1 Tax=Rotaria socialis TaxID=392032 RepID=A0A820M8X8_9BILA|nr:unnamed protein product [Rotaria socialis]CAF4617030.1 unnamed protein product [Rotaria socialis]
MAATQGFCSTCFPRFARTFVRGFDQMAATQGFCSTLFSSVRGFDQHVTDPLAATQGFCSTCFPLFARTSVRGFDQMAATQGFGSTFFLFSLELSFVAFTKT